MKGNRCVHNNNPMADTIKADQDAFLRAGGKITTIPLGQGSQTPNAPTRPASTNNDIFQPGAFNPHSEATLKSYARGGLKSRKAAGDA